MDYQAFAAQKFQQIVTEAPANNCSVLTHARGTLIDAGCDCPGGWMAAKYALEGLIGGRGQVGYVRREVGEIQMPCVELFLDDPVGAAAAFRRDADGIFGVKTDTGYALGVSLTGAAPALQADGSLIAATPNSLLAEIMEASTPISQAVEALHAAGVTDIQWAWSSCPLSATTNDAAETTRRRAETVAQYGVVSIWVRGTAEQIRQATDAFRAGKLCVHELASACTYQNS